MENPTLLYLPLNEQPDHLKNANDWQPKNLQTAYCAAKMYE